MIEDENYTYFYKVLHGDAFGRVVRDIVGNGLITHKEYNKVNGQLNYITTGYNGNNDVRDIQYVYDITDNVLSKTDGIQGITSNYGYDVNGNVVQKDTTSIAYTSYNKPREIQDAENTTAFYYAPNRARYKKTRNSGVTYYAGKLFEKEIANSKVVYKNFIYAGSELVAINVEEDDGELLVPSVQYLHKDALQSIDTITNESGEVLQRLVYKPFGERIVGSWIHQTSETNSITKRGFTGHEHISEFNLIHMNGRVYDPIIGRFLSADAYIQAPYDTQSYNRYSYVKNNPLRYTDPSGFFWKKVKRAFKKAASAIHKYVKYATLNGLILYSKPVRNLFTKHAFARQIGTIVASYFGGAAGELPLHQHTLPTSKVEV